MPRKGFTVIQTCLSIVRRAAWAIAWTGLSGAPLLSCEPPPVQSPPRSDLSLAEAIEAVTQDIGTQLGPSGSGERKLVIDPLLDGKTGQQTDGTLRTQNLLQTALPKHVSDVEVIPFDGGSATTAHLIASGSLTALDAQGRYRLSLAISDRNSGIVVAQSASMLVEQGLDSAPTRFYQESPSLVRDRSVDGYLRTAETEQGKPADALYIQQLPTAALLSGALDAYNAEDWEKALAMYNAAAARSDGQQLRTFNGMYLVNVQLNRLKEAEEAFGKIVALGLATNNLSVKLLFTPGTTDFWPDQKISGVYPMWLRQVAKIADQAGHCMNIVGHTSATGTDSVNDRLSLDRAKVIRTRLNQVVWGITNKIAVQGVGSRDNLVGTGTDDARDALDRRVEFKVVSCDQLPRDGISISAPPSAETTTPAPAPVGSPVPPPAPSDQGPPSDEPKSEAAPTPL